jgi:hypothetical protein
MLLFYFLTCVQKIKSMFQVKVARFLIRPEIGGSTLVAGCNATPVPPAVESAHDRLQKFQQIKAGWCFPPLDPPAGPVCPPYQSGSQLPSIPLCSR